MEHNIKNYAKKLELCLEAKEVTKELNKISMKLCGVGFEGCENSKLLHLINEVTEEIKNHELFNIDIIKHILKD